MLLSLRSEAEEVLSAALSAAGYAADDLAIEQPPEDVESVLASSVAFRLAQEAEVPPPAVAEEIAGAADVTGATYIGAIRATGPYVNVEPSDRYYAATLDAAQEDTYGQRPSTDERIVVEHTSANPTGPVHVGRARNPIIGDALARLLGYAGHDVKRHYYVNDAGRQVAVFTWAYETIPEEELPPAERDKPDYELVRYYRAGNERLEAATDDERAAAEEEIASIMQGLEAGDEETYRRVANVVDRVLEGMRQSLERLPAPFDEFVKETRFLRDGSTEGLVERLQALDESIYEEDAWQLDLSAYDIEKRLVYLRSDGTSLYPTRDLAHHEWKLERFDRAVTVLGEDHKLQAAQVRAALDLLDNDVDRLTAIHYGWVNLPGGGGMSTREGTGIDLDELLDEAIDRARAEVEDRLETRIRNDTLDEEDIERIARQVGIGAVRYDIVSKQPTKSITFDWDRALDFEAQSAPYLQYAHARCCGIENEADGDPPNDPDATPLTASEEVALLETMARFPAVVEEAAGELAPHQVATYARDLADAFNGFYRACPVLDAESELRSARLALVIATRHTLANSLEILGLEAPRSM